jgi:hypothetical protein
LRKKEPRIALLEELEAVKATKKAAKKSNLLALLSHIPALPGSKPVFRTDSLFLKVDFHG